MAVSRRGGAFGKPRVVPSSKGGWSVQVILNEDGRAIVHWREFVAEFAVRVHLVGLKVDGGFGKPRAVTPAHQYVGFDAAIGPGGRFTIVFAVGGAARPVYARIAPPSGRLGRRIRVATGGITAKALWYQGNHPMIAYTQASDDHGTLREREIGSGRTRVIANVTEDGVLVMDTASNGTQIAVWTGGDTDTAPERPLMAATRRPSGVFDNPQQLDFRLPPQEYGVAVARSGAAIVSWREWNESTTDDDPSPTPQYDPGKVITSYRPPGGRFGATQSLRPETDNAVIEGLSADIDSTGTAVLGLSGGRFAGAQRRLYTAILDEGGDPQVTPMTDFDDLGFRFHRVEIDERGRTAFSWIDGNDVVARRGGF